MKPKFKLFPRFHYTFRLIDIIFSLYSSSKKKRHLNSFFESDELYFLNSARAGISILLKSIAKGNLLRVGIQPYNCETAIQAIIEAGCIPVYIDTNINFNIDLNNLEAQKKEIDVLIVTHTFGIPADIDDIKSIMKGKLIIEDCAHAFLSRHKNRLCGTIGDASVFSMNHGKFPSIGHSGFVIINNKDLKENFNKLFVKLSSPTFIDSVKEVFRNFTYSLAFKPILYGLFTYPIFKELDKKYDFINKKKFTEAKGFDVNKNVFYNNFKRYLKINEQRKKKSQYFISLFPKRFATFATEGNNYYLMPLLINKRDEVHSFLLKSGYESGKHFSMSIDIAKNYGYKIGTCPNAENTVKNILVLPNVAYLTAKDMESITNIFKIYII